MIKKKKKIFWIFFFHSFCYHLELFEHFVFVATEIDALEHGNITKRWGQNKEGQTAHMCAIADNEFKRASVAALWRWRGLQWMRAVMVNVSSSENSVHILLSASGPQISKHEITRVLTIKVILKLRICAKYAHIRFSRNKQKHGCVNIFLLDSSFIEMSGLNSWKDQLVIPLWAKTTVNTVRADCRPLGLVLQLFVTYIKRTHLTGL